MSNSAGDSRDPADRASRRDIVLVVDDSPDTLGFLTEALERANITALVATDGEGALELVQAVTPDVILMDAVMPGLDGFETCRRLRADRNLSHIPVIFMTGLSETEHVMKGFDAGGVDYVTKPVVVEEMIARIRVHMTNARVAHGARVALDMVGRSLLATDQAGRLLWSTPQARALLSDLVAQPVEEGVPPPADLTERLADLARAEPGPPAAMRFALGGRDVELSLLSRAGSNEVLFRLNAIDMVADEQVLKQQLGLTAREADVLAWIARGKSNKDISDILAISPRTVNKHLEQIFAKLGVENRASAAVLAVRTLSSRD